MTFAITPLSTFPKGPVAEFLAFIEWRDDGVVLGDRAARVVDFVADPTLVSVTRGVGENSHIITVRKLLTSALRCLNGPQWTSRTVPDSRTWHAVAFGFDTFVIFGTNFGTSRPCSVYSTDGGVNWTTSPTTFPSLGGVGADVGVRERMLAFGAGQFIAIGNNKEIYSNDGINWTVGGANTFAGTPTSFFFDGTQFVLVCSATDKLYTSPGNGAYTERTLPAGDAWSAGGIGAGRLIVAASLATAKSDNGGVTWTAGGNLPADLGTGVWSIAYGNGVWVAVPGGSVTQLYYSTDGGATWALTNTLNASAQQYARVRYIGGIFYVGEFSGGNSCYKSTDGITWTVANAFVSMPTLFSIDWDGGVMGGGFVYAAVGTPDGNTTTVNSGVCG